MARIGYLFLNQGQWDGVEIVPADWVAQSITQKAYESLATFGEVSADGYGYTWWLNSKLGYYMAIGHGGQLIVVFPETNLLFVTTGDERITSGKLQALTLSNFIAPLELASTPLPENPTSLEALDKLVEDIEN